MNAEEAYQIALQRASVPGVKELRLFNLHDLIKLPPLPENLEALLIFNTRITNLPPLPGTLKILRCRVTQITELPPLPLSLEVLDCGKTQITKLPPLPPSLKYLHCDNTQITELPSLPPSLEQLDCNNTQITELPPLPPTLKELHCYDTQITELPHLSPSLNVLNCSDTQITSLPPLPKGLNELYCAGTNISTLPMLHYSLKRINLFDTQLKEPYLTFFEKLQHDRNKIKFINSVNNYNRETMQKIIELGEIIKVHGGPFITKGSLQLNNPNNTHNTNKTLRFINETLNNGTTQYYVRPAKLENGRKKFPHNSVITRTLASQISGKEGNPMNQQKQLEENIGVDKYSLKQITKLKQQLGLKGGRRRKTHKRSKKNSKKTHRRR